MRVQAVQHLAGSWSTPLPSELDGAATWVLAFASPDTPPDAPALKQLSAAFPQSVVMGCSTAGEIAGDAVHDDSICVAVAQFEHTRLRVARTLLSAPADTAAAGERLAAALTRPEGGQALRAVFVLSDGVCVNGSTLVRALHAALPAGVLVTGGLAGDAERFKRTWVLDGAGVHVRHIMALGLYGDRLVTGQASEGGWVDFGPRRQITRSSGNVLYELDGKPALELYRSYLGDRAAGLPGTGMLFPLDVCAADTPEQRVVRTLVGVDEGAQSVTFAGDLPEGGFARLTRSSTERLVDSAGRAADAALQGLPGPSLAVSVSCVARRIVLGQHTEDEVEAVASRLPAGAVHVGFYSYGEIAPGRAPGSCALHNQTMTVTAYGER